MRRDERERARRCRAVVLGEPERQLDERRGNAVDDRPRRSDRDPVRRLDADLRDNAAHLPAAEKDAHDRAALDLVRHLVREGPRERAGGHEGVDLGERHAGERIRAPGGPKGDAAV